jgi:hypothetical protein
MNSYLVFSLMAITNESLELVVVVVVVVVAATAAFFQLQAVNTFFTQLVLIL